MPATRLIKKRHATIAVTANAEVLFVEGGDVNDWAKKLTGRIKRATVKEAPTNRRPRWMHYGKPLKATIVASPVKFRMLGSDKPRLYSAVGSTAPHARYVDQGTGIYGEGRGAYQAKILPPYTWGSPSLFEATWKVPEPMGNGEVQFREVGTTTVKGQRPRYFFDKGLRKGMTAMHLASAKVPAGPQMSEALRSWPRSLENFIGNTPPTNAFMMSLATWRVWRDEAFDNGRRLGINPETFSGGKRDWARIARRKEQSARRKAERDKIRREKNRIRKAEYRKRKRAEAPTKPPRAGYYATGAEKRAAGLAVFRKQNPTLKIVSTRSDKELIVEMPNGKRLPIPWSAILNLAP